ncbi:hypothetical protein [Zhouia amylolytica]|uniref:Uncharacterized protein n=1 Tax=Zhouia amylolytica AD3 TaxID=1286632 RepID=W2UTM6_9FLAO|nr:hypothetical protein [Zhouia amylolytica]ETN96876.1 hypothetical protein P278_03020 [Zhouia amylolytica AD3]
MKIRSITFKPPEPKLKVIKSVTVYLSEKHSEIIIAPISKEPKAGYHYEQKDCEVIELNSSMEIIGKAIKRNFDKFNIEEKKTGMGNKSDWPAFKASKEKSMRRFEEKYRRISIRGLTDRNNTLRIETVLNLPIEIDLTSTISAHCEPSELGNRILKMFRSEITERK